MAFDTGTGEPVEPRTSNTSLRSILSNGDLSRCPDACFRPAGLALDAAGRLFMSSDATGEIYVLARAEMSITGDPPSSPTTTTGTAGSSAVGSESGARRGVDAPSRAFPFTSLFGGGGGGGSSGAVLGLGLTLLAYSLASCLAGLMAVAA